MKKKVIIAALATICAVSGVVALTACDNGGSGHTHDYDTTKWVSVDDNYHAHPCKHEGCTSVSGAERHDEQTEITATCIADGEEITTCAAEGCTYEKREFHGKVAHSWGEWTVAEGYGPSAEEEGTATRKCTVSGCQAEDEPLTLPVLSDSVDSGYTANEIEPHTCTENGLAEYTYVDGDNTVKFNAVVPKSHTYQAEITWEGGFPEKAEITCSECDGVHDEIVRLFVPENEGDTQAGSITEVYEHQIANCQQPGYSKRTATVEYNGKIIKTELKVISETEMTDHQYELNEEHKYGYDETKHWHVCMTSGCGHKDETSEQEHDYSSSEGVVIKYATATEQGERELECVCGHKTIVMFDGHTDNCDVGEPYYSVTNFNGEEVSQTPLGEIGGKYYYLGDGEPVVIAFSNLTNSASQVDNVELYYEKGGIYVPVIAVIDRRDGDEQPIAGGFIGDETSANKGKCVVRFYKVGGEFQTIGGENKYVGGNYAEVNLKLVINVGEESIAVEKTITFAPVPALDKPLAYNYFEYVTEGDGQVPYFNYKWSDLANVNMYAGQQYKFIASGYSVSVSKDGGSAEDLAETDDVFVFAPQEAGAYVITIANPYNPKASYTVNVTVNAAVDTAKLFAGKYAAGDYTVTFGEDNAITVQKDEEQAVNLTYTYEEGVFATTGSSTVSVILTPAYRLYIVDSGVYSELQAKGETTDEIYDILGGTSWEKVVFELTGGTQANIIVTISFNEDKSGTVVIKYVMSLSTGMVLSNQQSTFNFNYSAEKIDDYYKLNFNLVEGDYTSNKKPAYELGEALEGQDTKCSNDFCYINKDSRVTVNDDSVSLSLWLKTGNTNSSQSTEQAVEFDKVTE
ncbi:MAG: hypothetical protein NC033_02730 [Clostridiales bacterium]|nr:hypothetical protein [Clostridiales bacterium]